MRYFVAYSSYVRGLRYLLQKPLAASAVGSGLITSCLQLFQDILNWLGKKRQLIRGGARNVSFGFEDQIMVRKTLLLK